MFSILTAIIVGVVATFVLDIAAVAGIAAGIFRLPAFGRWFLYFLRGKFRHDDIEKSAALPGENVLTLPLHYLAGMGLVALYLLLVDWTPLAAGDFVAAVLYGLSTSLIPFLVMLPSMGYGLFGLRASPWFAWPRQILVMHLAYGVGIGIGMMFFTGA